MYCNVHSEKETKKISFFPIICNFVTKPRLFNMSSEAMEAAAFLPLSAFFWQEQPRREQQGRVKRSKSLNSPPMRNWFASVTLHTCIHTIYDSFRPPYVTTHQGKNINSIHELDYTISKYWSVNSSLKLPNENIIDYIGIIFGIKTNIHS